jgi:CO/xanthine dehydrogenase Mo-binding subunit
MPHDIHRRLAGAELVFESGDFPGLLLHAVEKSGYDETVSTLPDGQREAWGLATGLEGSGLVNFESANIRIDASGAVTVLSGMTQQGQGQITTFAQVCARALGAPYERITVRMGDTQLVGFGRGAFASRGAVVGANAVHVAAGMLKTKVLGLAATLLQTQADLLDVVNGEIVRPDGASAGLSLGDVARAFAPGGPLFNGETALGVDLVHKNEHPVTLGSSVHVARVRLDPRTGFYKVTDYLVAHDAGHELNPMVVEGQIIGGAVDGIGGAMLSEMLYGEAGDILTPSLSDYLVAAAPEIPHVRLTSKTTIPGTNLLGVRGIGEGGIIPVAAAIANALARAIDPAGTGHQQPLFTVPMKPERVFAACQLARAAG